MTKIKLSLLTTLLTVSNFIAQNIPSPPSPPGDDGGGTTGTGMPSSPIDQWGYILLAIGVFIILFQYFKPLHQKAKNKFIS